MKRAFILSLSLSVSVIFSVTVFSQTPHTSAKTKGKVPETPAVTGKASAPATVDIIKHDMSEALDVIENGYVGGKALNYNELFKTTIDTMLQTLDPHSNYYDAKDNEAFRAEQNSEYYGIGATIGDMSDASGNVIATYIKATFDGSPANLKSLKYGDKIIEVNGAPMLGKGYVDVRKSLRGPKGTTAKIVIERAANGERETVEIVRGAVSQPSISEIYMIRPGVGYMAMRGGFNRTTYKEFIGGMISLRSQGMRQLVLDLRDNGGGLVQQAYNVARVFLSSGQTIFSQKGRIEGFSETFRSDNPSPDRSPIVMLVNRGTASASEILAGALQDHDRALIVGENTFGKALVQNPFQDIGHESMLLLTVGKYQTPSGRVIQRDYSNGDRYNYYTDGGSFRDEAGDAVKSEAGKPDSGGINPDVVVKPKTLSFERLRLNQKIASPVFAFALDLVNGRVKGFKDYQLTQPVAYEYDLKATDFPVTAGLFQKFKQFAVEKYKIPAAQIDAEREFVERTLRSELVTAAHGSQTSLQVYNEYDNQLLRAIDLLPQARQLAMQSEKPKTKLSGE